MPKNREELSRADVEKSIRLAVSEHAGNRVQVDPYVVKGIMALYDILRSPQPQTVEADDVKMFNAGVDAAWKLCERITGDRTSFGIAAAIRFLKKPEAK